MNDVLAATGADIRRSGNQAYYAIGPNRIQMPPFESFRDYRRQFGAPRPRPRLSPRHLAFLRNPDSAAGHPLGKGKGDRFIFRLFFVVMASRSASSAVLDPPPRNGLNLGHETIVARKLTALQRLTHEVPLSYRRAFVHELFVSVPARIFTVGKCQVTRVEVDPIPIVFSHALAKA